MNQTRLTETNQHKRIMQQLLSYLIKESSVIDTAVHTVDPEETYIKKKLGNYMYSTLSMNESKHTIRRSSKRSCYLGTEQLWQLNIK